MSTAHQPTTPPAASQPAQSLLPDTTGLFTAGHLFLIAVLAVLVVIGLFYGARLRRRRHEAQTEVVEYNDAVREEEAPLAPAPPSAPPVVDAAPAAVTEPAMPHDSTADEAPAPAPLADEPIAAATPMLAGNPAAAAAVEPAVAAVEPAPEPAAPAAPPGPSPADGPVTLLKGLGPRVAERLAQHGITTVGQLAAMSDDEAQALDARLGPFTGRMGRDRWLEQARFLAAGDRAGFEAVFGRL